MQGNQGWEGPWIPGTLGTARLGAAARVPGPAPCWAEVAGSSTKGWSLEGPQKLEWTQRRGWGLSLEPGREEVKREGVTAPYRAQHWSQGLPVSATRDGDGGHPHFTAEKTEAQRSEVTCGATQRGQGRARLVNIGSLALSLACSSRRATSSYVASGSPLPLPRVPGPPAPGAAASEQGTGLRKGWMSHCGGLCQRWGRGSPCPGPFPPTLCSSPTLPPCFTPYTLEAGGGGNRHCSCHFATRGPETWSLPSTLCQVCDRCSPSCQLPRTHLPLLPCLLGPGESF